MFKANFVRLCSSVGKSPSAVCMEVGLSGNAYSEWKETTVPRRTTLLKLADYFGVTVDSLTGDIDLQLFSESNTSPESPTFYEKFVSLCSACGISPTEAANALHLGTGSVANWKKGGHPRLDTVQKVADFFGVPASSLTDPIDLQLFADPDTAPDPDRALLAKIHALSASDRALVLSLIDRLQK